MEKDLEKSGHSPLGDMTCLRKIRNTMTQVFSFSAKSLSRQRHKFLGICLACCQQRRNNLTALVGKLVAVAAGNFADNSMRAE